MKKLSKSFKNKCDICKKPLRKSNSSYCTQHAPYHINAKYRSLKQNALNRGFEVKITFEQYKSIVKDKKCSYCNDELITGSSLDRLDSNKGYTINNVTPCCNRCNMVKSNLLSYEEMKKVVDLLRKIRHNKKKSLWGSPKPKKQRLKEKRKYGI
jgi:hypothetical protein